MTTITDKATLAVSSPAFKHEGYIPTKYTCEGENINPPITINGIPKDAISLVLIMDDPDAPSGVFDHWIIWNIPPTEQINENSRPGKTAKNSMGESRYAGPCPPSGAHRYFFKVYALDKLLDLGDDTDKKMVEQEIANHIIAYGELMGLYKKRG